MKKDFERTSRDKDTGRVMQAWDFSLERERERKKKRLVESCAYVELAMVRASITSFPFFGSFKRAKNEIEINLLLNQLI